MFGSGHIKKEYRVGDDGSVWSRVVIEGIDDIDRARSDGCSWSEVANRLGYTASSVPFRKWQRHRNRKWKRLKPWIQNGYEVVCLGGDNTNDFVHQLVLRAFVGQCPENHEACHNNGIRDDNRLANLRWDTRQSNMDDKQIHGTHNKGERNGMSRLKESVVRRIRDAEGTTRQIADRFSVSQSMVSMIKNKKRWECVQ